MDTALNISRYIVAKSWERERPITNLRLQRLLYFLQALSLVLTGNPAFEDEIKAWASGPVVPTVYYEYSIFGAGCIYDKNDARVTASMAKLVDSLFAVTDSYTASELADIAKNQSPWIDANRITERNRRTYGWMWRDQYAGEIKVETIKAYFADIVEKKKKNKVICEV